MRKNADGKTSAPGIGLNVAGFLFRALCGGGFGAGLPSGVSGAIRADLPAIGAFLPRICTSCVPLSAAAGGGGEIGGEGGGDGVTDGRLLEPSGPHEQRLRTLCSAYQRLLNKRRHSK